MQRLNVALFFIINYLAKTQLYLMVKDMPIAGKKWIWKSVGWRLRLTFRRRSDKWRSHSIPTIGRVPWADLHYLVNARRRHQVVLTGRIMLAAKRRLQWIPTQWVQKINTHCGKSFTLILPQYETFTFGQLNCVLTLAQLTFIPNVLPTFSL